MNTFPCPHCNRSGDACGCEPDRCLDCDCPLNLCQCFGATSKDPINHPAHYTAGKVECIDAIESALGPEGFQAFLQGQVIKYAWRMNHKGNPAQDAGKLHWYAERLKQAKGEA